MNAETHLDCATKVPAPAPVQNAEIFMLEALAGVVSRFSTEFSTVVLKTLIPESNFLNRSMRIRKPYDHALEIESRPQRAARFLAIRWC
jgi:hypothetical protein